MRLFSNIISGMFHPLLMVTYGVILALSFTYLAIYPPTMKLFLVGGAFLSTAVIPGLFIFLMVKNGAAGDLELSDRKERVVPYLIIITSIMVCIFYMYKMMLPFWFLSLSMGSCVALLISLFINFFWKISAHALGIGGAAGRYHGRCPHPPDKSLLGLYYRVAGCRAGGYFPDFLKRHTPMQVYAGFCLGFICTFVASLLSYIYLFI